MDSNLDISAYKGSFLVVRTNGVDVIDSATGRWFTAKSMRAAKWNAAVWQRLNRDLKGTVIQ